MATKELMTRIQSKIATLAEWKAVEETFKPLRGEICIAEVESDPIASTAPTMLIKVGDGETFFKDLTWLSARAADVQSFLKVDSNGAAWTKSNFEAWIKSLVTIDDVDTSAFALKTEVQAVDAKAEKNKTDIAELTANYNTFTGTTYVNDKAELVADIEAAQKAADDAQDDLDAYKTSNDAAVGKALTDAKEYTDELKDGAVKTNTENIGKNTTAIATLRTDIQTGDSVNDFKAVETALAGKQAVGDYATKAEAQGYADAKNDAIAEAKKAGTDAAAAVTALENGKVKDNADAIAELETAVENLGGTSADTYETKTDAAQKLTDAKDYTDELANGQVKANKEAIEKLNGDATVEGSVDKKVADAINDFATKVTGDNNTYDTFKELVNYVANHGGEAAEMAAAIDALETKMGETSVDAQIKAAIAAENLDQYATDGDLAGLAGTVSAMDTAYKAADKTLQDNIDAAVGRVATLESEMDSAEGRLDSLEAHVKDVETNAEKNIIETVKVNGVALTPDASRAVNVTVPTGALASKDKVSKTDLGEALATELDAKATEADLTLAEGRISQNETDIDALQDKAHEHGNKALLDTYTQTDANLADAVAKKHEHANKAVIDGIDADDITTWNTVTSKAAASDLTAATNRVTALEDRIGFDGDVLIFNCGSSTINV